MFWDCRSTGVFIYIHLRPEARIQLLSFYMWYFCHLLRRDSLAFVYRSILYHISICFSFDFTVVSVLYNLMLLSKQKQNQSLFSQHKLHCTFVTTHFLQLKKALKTHFPVRITFVACLSCCFVVLRSSTASTMSREDPQSQVVAAAPTSRYCSCCCGSYCCTSGKANAKTR